MDREVANPAQPAELMGHSARWAMLRALTGGRALPMSRLASEAGVALSTASEHLTKLTEGGLLRVRPKGRRRYFELASPDVERALEILSKLGPGDPRGAGSRAYSLRLARTCYDHLAGDLGVAVLRSLERSGVLVKTGDAYTISARGRRLLEDFGVVLPLRGRQHASPCVDWADQHHHLGGPAGTALLRRLHELGWVRRHDAAPRALVVTDVGRAGFARAFGIDVPGLLHRQAA
ncbi:DNA-binding transcriptional ArsR family regulator [Amycolatopsis bartoniae]|uniref:Transcriptional regulator n=1 Tax=Amycolatopsis bartoniae TaxID=941986 RepID=A0A8H9IUT9_9PSEU|nr:helix-turn-helix domain-containing protein [Amycolatopsis bartoniae]MBB2937917.1 DNA-binding transcriptional ArsR family regulator [Amycolatopsis bartoniae]TVT08586.1 helix-turn-helix transcriptional regulator [Amycolatopsis bartoniae]GHF41681.1 transcriptional regulator [Amycolatopsis bartoniae]